MFLPIALSLGVLLVDNAANAAAWFVSTLSDFLGMFLVLTQQ
ncbi:hypothetical protein T4E_2725 [Trichinella pseudospiralis]|uniref:Uncharacterized protein n=1 Tax=Trichinella pseudospiralis TaxID=6337 RepID=A0A0V0WZR8_TRIPS|nr:hypothetical protein T4E_2725 [Trichinella pseudospiralis]